jgi:hypothetical protein
MTSRYWCVQRTLLSDAVHISAEQTPAATDPGLKHWWGGLVRLPFHDAASFHPTENPRGSSGCLNWADLANNGLKRVSVSCPACPPLHRHLALQQITDPLEAVYQAHQSDISRADLWALAGVTAVTLTGGPQVPFRWGRQDCNGTANDLPPIGYLPSAEGNWTTVTDVFVNRLGLTVQVGQLSL